MNIKQFFKYLWEALKFNDTPYFVITAYGILFGFGVVIYALIKILNKI